MARILIIEDNATNMKLVVFLLTHAGHEVLQANDADVGMRIAREQHPQLILMDVQLPGMDGLAATRLLKNDAATQHIKIMALTAFAMAGDREKMEAAGCDGYIAKPIRHQEFMREVAAMLGAAPCAKSLT